MNDCNQCQLQWYKYNQVQSNYTISEQYAAAVSCSPVPYRLGGVGFRFWLTVRLGRAWYFGLGQLGCAWCMVCLMWCGGGINLYGTGLHDTAAMHTYVIDL